MKKLFYCAFIALAILTAGTAVAQVSHGGEPLFNNGNAKAAANIHYLPAIDNNVYFQQDIDGVKNGHPMRIGIGQECDIDVLKEATVTKDANGTHFTMGVESPNATFVWVDFKKYVLPEGAELFIYDRTGELVLGSFNNTDVKADGRFYTQSIPGSIAFIEYNVPAGVEPGELQIGCIGHGYKDVFQMISDTYEEAEAEMKGPHGSAEGTCHINVACPEGDPWRDQIRSVVAIEIRANHNMGGYPLSFMCTGSLVNNTRQDRTPYVLSAFHCQDTEGMLDDLRESYPNIEITSIDFVSYFLYSLNTCNGTLGNGNRSVTGADIVAKYNYNTGSDMLLLRLQSDVPDSYKPYYAGWDRRAVMTPEPGVCIHHPGGDWKKISFAKSINSEGNFYKVGWFTGTENKGVTEQGSSGSPIFNAEKRIIGQLYAGSSSCVRVPGDYGHQGPSGTDYYGRFSVSWNGGGLSTNRLKTWLDPDNTDVSYMDGLNYTDDSESINPVETKSNHLAIYPNPTSGMVNFDIDFLGMVDYKVFDMTGRCVKEGSTVLTSTVQSVDIRDLPKGSYTMTVRAGNKTWTGMVVKQ